MLLADFRCSGKSERKFCSSITSELFGPTYQSVGKGMEAKVKLRAEQLADDYFEARNQTKDWSLPLTDQTLQPSALEVPK